MKTKEQQIPKAEIVPVAQIAYATPESKEFWAEYAQRQAIRAESQNKLVEPRQK